MKYGIDGERTILRDGTPFVTLLNYQRINSKQPNFPRADCDKLAESIPLMIDALHKIVTGLTSERNACWPTDQRWSKKERDEAMLKLAREALARVPT